MSGMGGVDERSEGNETGGMDETGGTGETGETDGRGEMSEMSEREVGVVNCTLTT